MSEPILAFHFRRLDGTTDHIGTPEIVGQEYRVSPPVRCCRNGLHGSIRAIDALYYASGPLLCRTQHGGAIRRQADKLCSEARTLLWQADATRTLHEFACSVAEEALRAEEARGRNPDPWSYAAIETKRRWLRGEASDSEIDTAWSAAKWAAWAAADSAADSAAKWATVGSEVWTARWSAARSAAWSVASARLEAMLLALEPVPAVTA